MLKVTRDTKAFRVFRVLPALKVHRVFKVLMEPRVLLVLKVFRERLDRFLEQLVYKSTLQTPM